MKKLTVIGNIGTDAKVSTSNGATVINFSLAQNETWTDKAGVKQEVTTWINCSIWKTDNNSNLAPYLKKGTQVFAEGKPTVRLYTDNAGHPAAALDMNVSFIKLLAPPRDHSAEAAAPAAQPAAQPAAAPAPQPAAPQAIPAGAINDARAAFDAPQAPQPVNQ